MFFRKLLERENSWLQSFFSGGATVKLKQGRSLLNKLELWQVEAVRSMEFCVPLKPSLEMRVSVSFVGLPVGSLRVAWLTGLEFGCDLGITLEIPFSIACLLLRTFWSGLSPSEKFAVLCFEIPSVNKSNYVNNQIFSFVGFASSLQ